MITSSFSQISYPKKILFGNDTVVAITKPQLIKINRALNDYAYTRKQHRTLQTEILILDSLCSYWKVASYKRDSIVLFEQQKYSQLVVVNSNLRAILKEEKKRSREIGIGVGVGGTLLGMLLGVLLVK